MFGAKLLAGAELPAELSLATRPVILLMRRG
jgi:hypothetical protein